MPPWFTRPEARSKVPKALSQGEERPCPQRRPPSSLVDDGSGQPGPRSRAWKETGANEGRSVKTSHRLRPAAAATLIILAALVLPACVPAPGGGGGPRLRGSVLEVAAVWSGLEQRDFGLVLRAFTRRTGVRVRYVSAGYSVPAFLTARLAAGRPPDVAFLPQPGLLRSYAARHLLVPLGGIAGAAVAHNFNPVWGRLGSLGGTLYGVWFKAANKSLIWYNEGVFERAGVAPPVSMDGLSWLARRLPAAGVPAFAVGGADGWTLADWFSNLYLRLAGPARYDLLAGHRIPWTDPWVKTALRLLATLLRPAAIAGGPRGALAASYQRSVQETFAAHPAAAMVFEGDFVAGIITGQTSARLGVDADVFPFPAVGRTAPLMVVAGGDAAVLLRRSPAGAAFIRFLASPQAAAIWAARGGFLSPNINLPLSVYPDPITRSAARTLIAAGRSIRFSLSDLAPASFGGTEGQGMRKILQRFLASRDVAVTAARLERAAARAYRP
jgi:alpha-glucoside transport system substrate-binding protein